MLYKEQLKVSYSLKSIHLKLSARISFILYKEQINVSYNLKSLELSARCFFFLYNKKKSKRLRVASRIARAKKRYRLM